MSDLVEDKKQKRIIYNQWFLKTNEDIEKKHGQELRDKQKEYCNQNKEARAEYGKITPSNIYRMCCLQSTDEEVKEVWKW